MSLMNNDDDIIIGGGDEVDEMEIAGKAVNEAATLLREIPVVEEEPEEKYDFSEPVEIGGDYDEDEYEEADEDTDEDSSYDDSEEYDEDYDEEEADENEEEEEFSDDGFDEDESDPEDESENEDVDEGGEPESQPAEGKKPENGSRKIKLKEKSGGGLPQPVIKPRDLTKVREAKQRAAEKANSGTGEDTEFRKEFLVASSPHLHYGENTRIIMQDVIISLMPAALVAIIYFGWRAAVTMLVCVAVSVLSEYLCRKVMKRRQTIGDYSAVVTGLLLAFCLPPEINPLFAAVGAVVAIVVVKQMFGGIGMNFANPAATARIVLMLSFPVAMTTWSRPFYYFGSYYDATSSPTPLAALSDPAANSASIRELIFGFHQGCLGEVCAIALVIGGLYLLLRGIISWHIPVGFIGTVMLFSLAVGLNPVEQALTGGVLLGAIFMATDYVTSPSNKWGKLIFGVGCGLLTMLIRVYGSMTEGVSFAILLMNIVTPHIERLTTPKPFGEERDAA